jgi:hypothetical protein
MLYNGFGVIITKNASGTQSCTIDISRTSFVWAFFLTVPSNPDGSTEGFHLLKLLGFIFITVGTLYFNEIIRYPRKKKNRRDHREEGCYFGSDISKDLNEPLLPIK